MKTERTQAFSDGVFAIIITIMVLELRAPVGEHWTHLLALWPKLVVYVSSFVYVGIYWNNHHHVFQAVRSVSGSVLWANLGLLFSLSLFPLATAWVGDTKFAAAPVSFYAVVALAAGLSYALLVHRLIRADPANHPLAQATASGFKEKVSIAVYVLAFAAPLVTSRSRLATVATMGRVVGAVAIVAVACLWVIPDRRIERALAPGQERPGAAAPVGD